MIRRQQVYTAVVRAVVHLIYPPSHTVGMRAVKQHEYTKLDAHILWPNFETH
jgi:hypothetical protein